VIEPIKDEFLHQFRLIDENTGNIDIVAVEKLFRSFMDNKWINDPNVKDLIESKGLQEVWKSFVGDIYEQYFHSGFDWTKFTDQYNMEKVQEIIEERLIYSIFDFVMRKHLKIGANIIVNVASEIDDYLLQPLNDLLLKVNEIRDVYLKKGTGLISFIESLSETFFVDPNTNRMSTAFTPTGFHGSILESSIFFNVLPLKVADLFIDYYEEYEFYGYIDLIPNNGRPFSIADFNRKILNDLNSHENNWKLEELLYGFKIKLDTPSKGRAPDLFVIDFMHLALSNHLKNTWEKSGKTSYIKRGITTDVLSAQLIDFYVQVWKDSEYLKTHINCLYSPYAYAGTMHEQKNSAQEILKEIFSRTNLESLLEKVNTKHVFISEVSQLINSYLEKEKLLNGENVDIDTVINFIRNLFDENGFFGTYPNFKNEINTIIKILWKGDKLQYILNQGDEGDGFYTDLMNVFIRNGEKLIINTPMGFRIYCGTEINYYFDRHHIGTQKAITKNMIPSGAKYLKLGMVSPGHLTNSIFNELLQNCKNKKTSLFVAHNKDGDFIIVDGAIINHLPKGVIEGYYHKGNDEYYRKTFHNVILNKPGTEIYMYGRVAIASTPRIRPLNWYEPYLKSSKLLTTSLQESKLLELQTGIEGIRAMVHQISYYTVFGYYCGNSYTNAIQYTTTELYPSMPFEEYLPGLGSLQERSRLDSLEYNIPSQLQFENMYSERFVQEFNEIFTELFRPDSKIEYQWVVPKALKYLDILNGYFINYDFENNFISGPNANQVNTRINDLFKKQNGQFDEEAFLNFIWKNRDGSFKYTFTYPDGTSDKYTTKMWLYDIYLKTKDYEGDNRNIIDLKNRLDYYSKLPDYEDNFNVFDESFTIEEAMFAEILFEGILQLFGHFTIRLSFANMLDHYYNGEGIGIKILHRGGLFSKKYYILADKFNHIGLITRTGQVNRLLTKKGFLDYKLNHLYGYFFLKSFIKLELDDNNFYELNLPYGSIISGLDESQISRIYETSRRSVDYILSEKLGILFNAHYQDFYELNPAHRFIESQNNLFKHLKEKAKDAIDILYKDKHLVDMIGLDRIAELYSQIIQAIHYGAYSAASSSGKDIRRIIDDFLLNKDSTMKLVFNGIEHPDPRVSGDFSIELKKSELLKVDFIHWDATNQLYGSSDEVSSVFTHTKREYLLRQVEDVKQYLIDEIILKEQLGSGKVRLFPLVNREGCGYQFISLRYFENYRWYLPRIVDNNLGYFDIDLSNFGTETYRESEIKLRHVINIIQSIDCVVIMTKLDDNLREFDESDDDNRKLIISEMICAFTRDKILNAGEIYSLRAYEADLGDYRYPYRVIVQSDLKDEINEMNYLDSWSYNMLFSRGDLKWYRELIRNDRDKYWGLFDYLRTGYFP